MCRHGDCGGIILAYLLFRAALRGFQDPHFDQVPLLAEHPLVDVPRVILRLTDHLTLIVYVLLLDRQVADVADEFLSNNLAVLVHDGLENVAGPVNRALGYLSGILLSVTSGFVYVDDGNAPLEASTLDLREIQASLFRLTIG